MIIEIIVIMIGLMLFCGGAYYLTKEKDDREAKKVYAVTLLVGAVIILGTLIKIFIF